MSKVDSPIVVQGNSVFVAYADRDADHYVNLADTKSEKQARWLEEFINRGLALLSDDLSGAVIDGKKLVGTELWTYYREILTIAPMVGTRWRHFKGGEYVVDSISLAQDTLEPLVNYSAYNTDEPCDPTFTRRLSGPNSWTDTVWNAEGVAVPRFSPVPEVP